MKTKLIKILIIIILALLTITSKCYAATIDWSSAIVVVDYYGPRIVIRPPLYICMILALSISVVMNFCFIWSYKITSKTKSILMSIIPFVLGIASIIMIYPTYGYKGYIKNLSGLILYGINILIVLLNIIYIVLKKRKIKKNCN